MKRTTDEIRYLMLKILNNKQKYNVESVRKEIGTGLPSILQNAENLEIFGFIKTNEVNIGKRKYRELEITEEGKKFFDILRKKYENGFRH